MATSPAANVFVTGTPRVELGADDDTLLDVPEEDKRFSLMIESSKTENPAATPRRKKKTRRGKKKLRRGPPDGGTVVDDKGGSTVIDEQKDGNTVVDERKDGASEAVPSRPRSRNKENTVDAAGTDNGAAAIPAKKPRLNRRQRRRRSSRQPAPILRPLEVPRAPRNSTSFLIDDHENSAFYIDFDATQRTPTGGSDRSRFYSSTTDDDEAEEAAYQYSMKDFEAVYRHAREEELAQLARPQLVDCVRQLEARVRELEGQLTLYDPEVWVQNLQNQLLHLQEENRLLAKTREVLLKRYDGSDAET